MPKDIPYHRNSPATFPSSLRMHFSTYCGIQVDHHQLQPHLRPMLPRIPTPNGCKNIEKLVVILTFTKMKNSVTL